MNRSESEDGRREIVIVRRGGHDDEEGAHGGVWKIAFADFMTAMMCFFLVMWLVNASNEQTRVALASYFNPIKLVDRETTRKGIDDVGKGPQSVSTTMRVDANTDRPHGARRALSGPADNETASNNSDVAQHSDENLFADPYAVLAEIAADTGHLQNLSAKGDGGAADAGPASGASGGPSYRDPFAPDFWSTQIETPTAAEETALNSVPEGEVTAEEPPAEERFAAHEPRAAAEASLPGVDDELARAFSQPLPEPAGPETSQASGETAEPAPAAAEETPAGQGAAEIAAAAVPDAAAGADDARLWAAEKLASEIRAELAAAFGGTDRLDGVSVEQTDGGVRISIVDDIRDGMFEIGSAVPRRQLVLAMEKIGKALAAHEGTVTINGHTDARPFANARYDNWRLSTARAQATYYMLVRGGLAETRVGSVAGFADRRLKQPDDPYAAVNRRIEILLDASG